MIYCIFFIYFQEEERKKEIEKKFKEIKMFAKPFEIELNKIRTAIREAEEIIARMVNVVLRFCC